MWRADLVEGVWGVDGLEFFRSILSGVLQDYFGAAWVLKEEFGHIINFPVDNNPARVFAVMFCDILTSQFGVHVVLLRTDATDRLE